MKKLVLLLVVMMQALVAMADKSGTCGTNLTWTYTESTQTLTIEGSGAMKNYNLELGIYPGYISYVSLIKKIVIGDEVTTIGNYAFYGCTGLSSISIPSSVTSIGSGAFYGCSGLSSISIPSSVTSIGSDAFLCCSGLSSISIPSSVTSIGSGAFYGCSGLTSIMVEAGNTKYDSRDNCNAIIETASNTLMSGGNNTIIPDNISSIDSGAFYGCSGLSSISIPSSVTSIGSGAFLGCSGLTSITVDEGNTVYDSRGGCNAIIETASNTLFYGCKNTNIPDGISIIGDGAFYGCSGLSSIDIPNSVTNIGSLAFYNCKSLTSITIPSSVESIAVGAFQGCSNLSSVNMGNGVTSLGWGAFSQCTGLISISLSNSLTSIETITFESCSNLTSIIIPNSVKSIEDSAFGRCSGLTSITIGTSLKKIGKDAFSSSPIRNIITKSSNCRLGEEAFLQATFNHAMLYVPSGQMWDFIYKGAWYQFINIREMADETDELSAKNAYTLMNAKTFEYVAYDEVNNALKTIDTYKSVDENVANNCWQIVKADSKHYLYNIGAKKYAAIGTDGKLKLSSQATPLNMTNGNNGIIIGENSDYQWHFVLNEKMSIDQSITGIANVRGKKSDVRGTYYDLNGRKLSEKPSHKGIYINNGKKLVVK